MAKSFSERVYDLARKIPKGRVTTYKVIAEKLGSKAYRLVGQALKHNPCSFPKGGDVPCHRVVCSDCSLGGFAGKLNSKKKVSLLRKEGIEIKDNKVKDFKERLFKF